MTGAFTLDWAIVAVSLFNTVVLLWLGLTVLLNAERRSWGVWLAGGGLLIGGAFFISHSAILGHNLSIASRGTDLWWHAGWLPVIVSPFAWYVVMLWYSGFWEASASALRRRQRLWLALIGGLSAGLIGLLLFANPLPSYRQVVQLDLAAVLSVGDIPLLILVYPPYIVLCILLSLDALLHQAQEAEEAAELTRSAARRRARPWLIGSTAVLLIVSLLVGWVMAWIILNARQRIVEGIHVTMAFTLAWFDLTIASLIALAVVLLGQAVVAYEVFTGETLPRRGFFRHWRNILILAAGYGMVVGWSLTVQLRPIYMLLLATIVMAVFYALLSWRSFSERERYMADLRPFVSSQRLYESLLARSDADAAIHPEAAASADAPALFRALCENVLGAQRAYLVALGALAPAIGTTLTYPDGAPAPLFSWTDVIAQFSTPQKMCVALDPARHGGAIWAVSLWSERGLIGLLLLGPKGDGGLYTREEIEIARASGERLIDTQATTETSRRLMALLRQRIAQVKVMEGRGRRVLHDQVLPQLHAAILYLSGAQDAPAVRQAMETLTSAHRQISDLMQDTASAEPDQLAQQGLIAALSARVSHDLARDFTRVSWHIEPEAAEMARRLPLFVSQVTFFAAQELIRNAARHGRGGQAARELSLKIALKNDQGLRLVVEDDGVGFILSARSATETPGGTGNGLPFHSAMLAAVGGSLEVIALPERGTRATISLPLSSLCM